MMINALLACGINLIHYLEIFSDNFQSCMDITFTELEADVHIWREEFVTRLQLFFYKLINMRDDT